MSHNAEPKLERARSRRSLFGLGVAGAAFTLAGCKTTTGDVATRPASAKPAAPDANTSDAFNDKHKAFADAIMYDEAYKLFGKPRPSYAAAKQASYQSSVAADRRLRPGKPNGWYTATADAVNREIERIARRAINDAYKALPKAQKSSAFNTTDAGVGALTTTAAALFGVAAKNETTQAIGTTISRRGLITGGVALAVGAAVLAPTAAMADNTSYINDVNRGARVYTTTRAPSVTREAYGAGIRASLETLRPQYS